jgi:SH3-like domain-containing protein
VLRGLVLAAAGLLASGTAMAAGDDVKLPYWASISAKEALMRAGPGSNFPTVWRYVRPGLPVKVVARHEHWRKIEEPDGTQGWMNGILLSEDRTAIVTGAETAMRAAPESVAKIRWRVAPGVVGKISECDGSWCKFAVHGRTGYVEIARLWGVAPGETVD